MKKRTIAILLVVLMLLSLFPISALATEDAQPTTITAESNASSSALEIGDTLQMTYSLSGTVHYDTMKITLGWNEQVVRFDGFTTKYNEDEEKEVIDSKVFPSSAVYNQSEGIITWTSIDERTRTGQMFVANFTVTGAGKANIGLDLSNENTFIFALSGADITYALNENAITELTAQAPAAHTHTLAEHTAAAATCKSAGNSAYWSCDCGKFFSDAEGTNEIAENSWVIEKTAHTDEKNNTTQANGKDGLCDVCGEYCNHAPIIKDGVEDVSASVVLGEAYLLRDLQAGNIFEDPDGDKLSVSGGGAGNSASSTCFYYNRSTDGGETWGEELDFAGALFGATTISLTETVAGTYMYRFYAKDGYGGDSRDNETGKTYWTLTLTFDTAANLQFDVRFFIGKDQNFSTNDGKYPIIKLWKSDGHSNKVGNEIEFNEGSNVVENNYNMMYATVTGGWYVYEGYGWNKDTNAYDIPLGGMQIKLPADSNVDGNVSGGTNIYLRVMSFYTTSKKTDNTYFGDKEYSVRVTCPIMQCDAVMGTPYKSGNYAYYPTLFYAGGNSCLFNYYLYPTDTENYIFSQSINATLATGNTVQTKSGTINIAVPITVTVPQSADFALYFQYNNFNTAEQNPSADWVNNNADGTKTATYKVSKSNGNYSWRMTDTTGLYVTKGGWLTQLTAAKELHFDFNGSSKNKNSHDFTGLGTTTISRDEADLQVFVDPTGAKALGTETERIRAYRMWQLINSDTANIMIEPDYTWTKLSGPAEISFIDDTAVITGTQIDNGNGRHNWADINAKGGTSIFAVRYDALDLDTSNNATHGGFYPATNPDRTAFVVIADELGTASAHVQFNGDYEANARSDEWDYIYDTWYYLDTETNPMLTFTTKGATTAEYAVGTTDGATMTSTVSAFTAVTAEEGKYYVPLNAFNNAANNYGGTLIIRMTDAAGKISYQLVKIARMHVTIENETFPGENIMPGNTAKVTFDGLYRSINKISGIFNPTTFYLRYTIDGTEINGTTGQYQQMDTSSILLNIPADITFKENDTTSITATNGYVFGSMYSASNPFGAMYMMTDTGVGTNFNAVNVSFAFQKMSDIEIPVVKMPTTAVTIRVAGSDQATIVLTDSSGAVQTAVNGVYTLGFGTYKYSVEAEGFIKEVGKFYVGRADNGEKTVTVTLRAADETTWDGITKTAVTPNTDGVYEIRTGAELAWLASKVNDKTGSSYNAILMNDISLGCKNWTPIGNASAVQYKGTFDGRGHKITDLYCEGAGYVGLFGSVGAGGVVKNFALYGEVNSTKSIAGGVCGYTNGAATFEGLANYADVNITGVAATANAFAGGIVGQGAATTTIQNCYNAGNISTSGKGAGGICAGSLSPKVINCYNIGKVTTASTTRSSTGSLGGAGTATNSYYLNGTTNGTKNLGTAKTEAELKALAGTLGAAFRADDGNINNGYPVLFWQDAATMATAANVETLIDAIGTPVNLASQAAITAAREAYDNLAEMLKGFVGNYAVLTEAEYTLKNTTFSDVEPTVVGGQASATISPETEIKESFVITATTEGGNAEKTTVTIPATVAAQLDKAASFELTTDSGTLVFDGAALSQMTGGEAVEIAMAAKTELNGEITLTLTAMANGKSVFANDGAGLAEVTITANEPEAGKEYHVYFKNGETLTRIPAKFENSKLVMTLTHFSEYIAKLEEPDTGYTVALGTTQTKAIGENAEVTVSVNNNDTTKKFNTIDVTLTYDTQKLALTTTEIAGMTLEDNGGTVHVYGYGEDRDLGEACKLVFKAIGIGGANVALTGAKVDSSENAVTEDAPDAIITASEVKITVTGYTVTLPTDFTGTETVQAGSDYTFTAKDLHYNYTVTATMGGKAVDVIDNQDGTFTIENIAGNLVITAEKTAKQYNVTVNGNASGDIQDAADKATYGTDYKFMVNKDTSKYTYTVTAKIGTTEYSLSKVGEYYVISGGDITDDITITANREEILPSVTAITFEGAGSADVVGGIEQSAANGTAFTFTITKAEGYLYTVSAKKGQTCIDITDGEVNTYTIAAEDIDGTSITVTVEKVGEKTVSVSEYVTLNGKSAWLVTVTGTLEEGRIFAYGEDAMFWSEKYEAYCWLILSEESEDNVKTAAEEAVTVKTAEKTEISYNGDVNGTGTADINDAQLVYDIYNAKYGSFDTVSMLKFLRADMNGDKSVKSDDAVAVVNIVYSKKQ